MWFYQKLSLHRNEEKPFALSGRVKSGSAIKLQDSEAEDCKAGGQAVKFWLFTV